MPDRDGGQCFGAGVEGWTIILVHVALHAADALRITKDLVRFYHALTQRSLA